MLRLLRVGQLIIMIELVVVNAYIVLMFAVSDEFIFRLVIFGIINTFLLFVVLFYYFLSAKKKGSKGSETSIEELFAYFYCGFMSIVLNSVALIYNSIFLIKLQSSENVHEILILKLVPFEVLGFTILSFITCMRRQIRAEPVKVS